MPRGAGQGRGDEARNEDVVLAGALAGVIARFVIAPLDVVKIRLQTQPHSLRDAHTTSGPTYSGLISPFRTIIREEGLTALWKGNVPAEILYLLYGGAQFLAYRNVNVLLEGTGVKFPEAVQGFIAGTAAGAGATVFTYPLDTLRTRFAVQGTRKVYHGLGYAIRHIYIHEGSKGFFRGLGSAVAQIAPNLGIFFGVYEPAKRFITHYGPESAMGWESGAAGAVASTLAKTVVFPLDLVRKRLQVQGPTRNQYVHRNIPVYQGIFGALRDIRKLEGWRGWYKGLTISLLKAAPSSAVTMFVFEHVMKLLQQRNN